MTNIDKHPILKRLYELAIETEKLPASEQQTKVIMLISDISRDVEVYVDTRSNSPDTVKLERLDYKELGEIFHKQFPLGDWCGHYKYALAKTAIEYCARFGTVKESKTDHTNYACICKECGGQLKESNSNGANDQLLTGGEGK